MASFDNNSVGSCSGFAVEAPALTLDDFNDDDSQSSKRQCTQDDFYTFNYVDRMVPMVGPSPYVSTDMFAHNLEIELFEENVSMANVYALVDHHAREGNVNELSQVQAYQAALERNKYNYVRYKCASGSVLRVYPNACRSIGQSFSRVERAVLACDIPASTPHDIKYDWIDIDMVNAAPEIMRNVFIMNAMPCQTLTFYCKERDTLINLGADVNISRACVKKLFCAAMNGARVFVNAPRVGFWHLQFDGDMVSTFDLRSAKQKRENTHRDLIVKTADMPPQLRNALRMFAIEMHDNALILLRKYERANMQDFLINTLNISANMSNRLGCFVARVFNMLERMILTCAVDFCISEGVSVKRNRHQIALIHDGFMLRTKEESLPDLFLYELSEYVRVKLGIEISFDIKTFDDTIVKDIISRKAQLEEIKAARRGKTVFDCYKTEDDATMDWQVVENYPQDDRQKQIDFAIEIMNKYFAVVEKSDPPFILTKCWKAPYHKKDSRYCEQVLISQQNFKAAHANRYIYVRQKLLKDGTWKLKRELLTDIFLTHRNRLSFDDVTFVPTNLSLSNVRLHNLFTGFAIEPWRAERFVRGAMDEEGISMNIDSYLEKKCEPFIELLRDHVIGKEYEYFLNWAAHIIQPQTRAVKTAKRIDLFSKKQGVGKGIVVDFFLGTIIGSAHYLKITDLKMLESFNSLISKACLIFADEAYFTGDHSAAAMLKNIVSEYELLYNRKNVAQWVGTNYCNVITANNLTDSLPKTEVWSRRVSAFTCPSRFGGQTTDESEDFFVKKCLKLNPHFVAAYLYRRDITGFNPRKGPITERLVDQIRASFPRPVRYIFNLLHNEKLPYKAVIFPPPSTRHSLLYDEWADNGMDLPEVPDWKFNSVVLSSRELYADFQKATRGNSYIQHVQFCQTLREVLRNVGGFVRCKKLVRGKEERCYKIPSLVDCRRSFCEYTANGSRVVTWDEWISEGYNSVHF